MKIGMRLGLGFGVLVLLLIVISVVSLTCLKRGAQRTEQILNDRYAKIALINQIKSNVNTEGRNLRNALLSSTPEDQQSFLELADKASNENKPLLAQLDKLINIPEGRAIFSQIADTRDKYLSSVIELTSQIHAGQKEIAAEALFNIVIPPQNDYLTALAKFDALQSRLMERDGKESREQASFANVLVTALSILAVILAIATGILITRSVTRPISEAVEVARSVAAGDLTMRIEVNSTDETGRLLLSLKDMSESLVNIVGKVRVGTDTIAVASAQISAGNLDLASRTEEQAGALEETASSMEELTSTVKQNAGHASHANQMALSASEIATKGGRVMSDVISTMGSINDSAKKIADIISVIDGIAFQTNILALNAAVEAARAGEQGRGFAVVASEVRNLAQRSAAAAKEIKTLIDNSVEQVGIGSKLVDHAGVTMGEIVQSIKNVTDIMTEIAAASNEQTAGIEQINQAVMQMDNVTQQNSALVEQASASARSLEEQAAGLVEVVSIFKLADSHSVIPFQKALPRVQAEPARNHPQLSNFG